jgi:hypothetical protein
MKETSDLVSIGSSETSLATAICRGAVRDHKKKEGDDGNVLSETETKQVNRVRVVVAIVLVVATVMMAITIYIFVRTSERNNFLRAFDSDAERLFDGVGESIKSNLAAMDAFASMMVSMAKQTNQTFPFVTLPTFGIKASKLLSLTDAFVLTTQPVVTSDQRLQWEAYAIENKGWVNETKQLQEMDEFFFDTVIFGEPDPTAIIGLEGTLPYDSK